MEKSECTILTATDMISDVRVQLMKQASALQQTRIMNLT